MWRTWETANSDLWISILEAVCFSCLHLIAYFESNIVRLNCGMFRIAIRFACWKFTPRKLHFAMNRRVALRHLVWIVNLIPISFICFIWNVILMHSFGDHFLNTKVLSDFTWKRLTTNAFLLLRLLCHHHSSMFTFWLKLYAKRWIIHRKWKIILHSFLWICAAESIPMMNIIWHE